RIDPLDDALVLARVAGVEVLAAEAVTGLLRARPAERANQVGDGVAVLANGEARQLDPRQRVAGPGLLRVEGVEDVLRDRVALGGGQAAGVVLWHGLGDDLGKLRELLFAGERVRV